MQGPTRTAFPPLTIERVSDCQRIAVQFDDRVDSGSLLVD